MPQTPITREQAKTEIEDAMTQLGTPNCRGMATGLCGAFYLAGLLTHDEWQAYLGRIPAEESGNGPTI